MYIVFSLWYICSGWCQVIIRSTSPASFCTFNGTLFRNFFDQRNSYLLTCKYSNVIVLLLQSKKTTMKLLLIAVLLNAAAFVSCFPTGAPVSACGTVSPNAASHGAQTQSSQIPYTLNTGTLAADGYVPGQTYTCNGIYLMV